MSIGRPPQFEGRVYGGTAVVSGEYVQKGLTQGEPESVSGVSVTTWLRRDGRWQAIASGLSRAVK
ncbi:MAG: hypothetical protein DMF80_03065 [Acidobacteria bacterium]|nr:MAG: hypothetical protein DMF80_03065 [Acidobacteriota bacterium]